MYKLSKEDFVDGATLLHDVISRRARSSPSKPSEPLQHHSDRNEDRNSQEEEHEILANSRCIPGVLDSWTLDSNTLMYYAKTSSDQGERRLLVHQNDHIADSLHLIHPPIISILGPSSSKMSLHENANDDYVDMLEENNCDDYDEEEQDIHNILIEDESIFTEKMPPQHLNMMNKLQMKSEEQQHQLEWAFSVVFSDVWQVPVLYFRVQYINGVPLSRAEVLKVLRQQPNTCNEEKSSNGSNDSIKEETISNDDVIDDDDEGWNFVSYEEHPITGIPSFFLHPCQTSKRLYLLMMSSRNLSREDEKKNSHPPSTSNHVVEETKCNKTHPSIVLLSWLSMILPSVGFRIPPSMFQSLRESMLQEITF